MAGDAARLLERVQLREDEAAPCPACGELMREVDLLQVGDQTTRLWRHLDRCPAYLRQERRAEVRKARQSHAYGLLSQATAAEEFPAAPIHLPTKRSIDSLAVYTELFSPSFSTPEGTHYRAMVMARRFLKKVTEERTLPKTAFGLHGAVGAGKTTLLSALLRDVVRGYVEAGLPTRNRCPVVWWNEPALWKKLTDAMDRPGGKGEAESVVRRLVTAPIAVLDNLGGVAPNPWWIDNILFHIVNTRYDAALPTFATSKFDLAHLRHEWSRPVKGQFAACAPDLLDRLTQRTLWTPVLGESNRHPEIDF